MTCKYLVKLIFLHIGSMRVDRLERRRVIDRDRVGRVPHDCAVFLMEMVQENMLVALVRVVEIIKSCDPAKQRTRMLGEWVDVELVDHEGEKPDKGKDPKGNESWRAHCGSKEMSCVDCHGLGDVWLCGKEGEAEGGKIEREEKLHKPTRDRSRNLSNTP